MKLRSSRQLRIVVLSGSLLLTGIPAVDVPAGPSTSGKWTSKSSSGSNWGVTAVHLALLRGDGTHHSKVAYWSAATPSVFFGGLKGWNPTQSQCDSFPTSSFTSLQIATPGYNIFCVGHSILADGTLFITGGSDVDPRVREIGIQRAVGLDQNSLAWQGRHDMASRRWYPTNTTLPDGDVLTAAGTDYPHLMSFGGSDASGVIASDSLSDLGLLVTPGWEADHFPSSVSGGLPPSRREGHALVAYPDYHGSGILFGGLAPGQSDSLPKDVWYLNRHELDAGVLFEWQKVVNAAQEFSPQGRRYHAAASARNKSFVILGGLGSGANVLDDVFLLKPVVGVLRWRQLTPTGTGPRFRSGMVAVTDSIHDRVIFFGGAGTSGTPSDSSTYILTMTATDTTWNNSVVILGDPLDGSFPSPREGHVIVRDAAHGHSHEPITNTNFQALMVGGRRDNTYFNDTWLLHVSSGGDTLQWQRVNVPAAFTGRARMSADFDRISGRTVIYGGITASGAASDSCWAIRSDSLQTAPRWIPLEVADHARQGHTVLYLGDPRTPRKPERYHPSTDTWTELNAPKWLDWYPFNFVLPSGNVFHAGPARVSNQTDILNLTTNQWRKYPANSNGGFVGGSAVMYRPGQILKTGSRDTETSGTVVGTAKTIAIFDNNGVERETTWVSTASMLPRVNHNLTLLPDGNVLVSGGLETFGNGHNNNPVRTPQIWSPATGQWTPGTGADTLAKDPAIRGYHSTTVLLPDGRVLSASGNSEDPGSEAQSDQTRFTIFCPPYLFDANGALASRPVIDSVKTELAYGESFHLCSPQMAHVSSVALIRSGASTHGFDQNQRYVPLSFSKCTSGTRLSIVAPATANLAPPGDYLLFIVRDTGVPAIAKWIRLAATSSGTNPICECTGGGGCPVLESRTAQGWVTENTILNRSLGTELTTDLYRLKGTPTAADGRYELRIRENEQERTTLDHLALLAVSHDPADRVFACGDRIVSGTRVPARKVSTHTGRDVTSDVSGSGMGFLGGAGDTLLVELNGRLGQALQRSSTGSGPVVNEGEEGGGLVESSGKEIPPDESRRRVDLMTSGSVDERVLTRTGLLVQVPFEDGWRTVRHIYPRETSDEVAFDSLASSRYRLVFVGTHRVNFLGTYAASSRGLQVQELPIRGATHSRAGDVGLPLGTADGQSTTIEPGDTLRVAFEATSTGGAESRTLFLWTRGAYTGDVGAGLASGSGIVPAETQFALGPARPSPSKGIVSIHLSAPRSGPVALHLYDVAGRLVRTLFDGELADGVHEISWDLRNNRGVRVSAGVYFYRLVAGEHSAEQRVVVLEP